MHATQLTGVVVAALNKHHFVGVAGMVVGALLVVVGGMRILTKAAGAVLVPVAGLVVVVLGILLYARKI